MPTAIILSSYVAASRIGGVVQQLTLSRLEFDPILIPTVSFGRSPASGGVARPTDDEAFERMVAEVEAEGAFDEAAILITGYFVSARQVQAAARAVEQVRNASPDVAVVVDPIMGDGPKGLYVEEAVARALSTWLVPAADWITPNGWELSHLSGLAVTDAASAAAAAYSLGKPALVTSIPGGQGEIGAVCADGEETFHYLHPQAPQAPNGLGDLMTAVFAAGLADSVGEQEAAAWATRAALKAVENGVADLSMRTLGETLLSPDADLRVEAVF